MADTPLIPKHPQDRLAQLRARLQSLRERARQHYASGAHGLQVATLISEMTDQLITELFEENLQKLPPEQQRLIREHSAIVSVGGSGRGELAPFSDADILFLHRSKLGSTFTECIAQMVRDCWDSGIKLGHSVRTLGDTLGMALREPEFATAVIESRYLWGDKRLFDTLTWRFYRKVVRGRRLAFYNDCVTARQAEREQFGETVRQLEPDVKRSPGGLRDLHLIRWIGYAQYQTTNIDFLYKLGALNRGDSNALIEAQEFLTRVRVELHFAAGRAQEVLTRAEQLRLAELFGYTDTAGQRGVERFMQVYFRHSTAVADIAQRFVAVNRPTSLKQWLVKFLLTHRSNQKYIVGPDEIDVRKKYRDQVCRRVELLLNIYELAGLYSVSVAPSFVEEIKQAVPQLLPRPSLTTPISPQASALFLSILRQTGHVGELLRGMYGTGLLEYILPEMSHARCLLQFNQYHKYTVDEHSLKAVEAAENFEHDQGAVGAAYREIRHKEILHLALLIHDLGKGFEEDHSEVGSRLALQIAQRLGLSSHLQELLVFLVHRHLIMSTLAFRRDLTDPEVLLRFSRDVGSPEYLKMLYVLTAADMTAVGPGTWTEWKAELVTELYDRAMLILSGEHQHYGEQERLSRVTARVEEALGERITAHTREQLGTFPAHYLSATPSEQVVADLDAIDQLAQQPIIVRSRYESSTDTVDYRIITRDSIGSGLFSKITGALTAHRLEILSAQICTTSEGVVVDAYRVHDGDHAGEIPEFRQQEIAVAIADVLTGKTTVERLLQRNTRFEYRPSAPVMPTEPTRVVIDNDSSARFTIIDVFAHDRPGLLYTIARTLLELDLSVSLAKIGTHVDQVLDVFYVTDRLGAKLTDEQRLKRVQSTLESRLEEFTRTGLEQLTPVT